MLKKIYLTDCASEEDKICNSKNINRIHELVEDECLDDDDT